MFGLLVEGECGVGAGAGEGFTPSTGRVWAGDGDDERAWWSIGVEVDAGADGELARGDDVGKGGSGEAAEGGG